MQCYDCVNPAVCHIKGDKKSWMCEECAICGETLSKEEIYAMSPENRKTKCCYTCTPEECDRCREPVYARIEWDVGCKNKPIRLQHDVCKKHVDDAPGREQCNCSATARNKSVTVYTWL